MKRDCLRQKFLFIAIIAYATYSTGAHISLTYLKEQLTAGLRCGVIFPRHTVVFVLIGP